MGYQRPVGEHLKLWRQRRRLSQLALACEAEISTRHLSFLETGRAQPSRDMVLHLSEALAIPLRERNAILLAAGFAPVYAARPLDDPALEAARAAVDLVLAGHEPYPALAVDRHWTLVAANRAIAPLLQGVAPSLLQGEVNVLRLALHPDGLAPRIVNFAEWRGHLVARLRAQIEASADETLEALYAEFKSYPAPKETARARESETPAIAVPLILRTRQGDLSFISTVTVFGTPVDVTLSELAIESFFPADRRTAEALRALARN